MCFMHAWNTGLEARDKALTLSHQRIGGRESGKKKSSLNNMRNQNKSAVEIARERHSASVLVLRQHVIIKQRFKLVFVSAWNVFFLVIGKYWWILDFFGIFHSTQRHLGNFIQGLLHVTQISRADYLSPLPLSSCGLTHKAWKASEWSSWTCRSPWRIPGLGYRCWSEG